MARFRKVIATAGKAASAAQLAAIARNSDPEREIIAVPLADDKNQFSENPLNNAGQVTALSFNGSQLIADLEIRKPEVVDAINKGLIGGAVAIVDKGSSKIRFVGLSNRPSSVPVALSQPSGDLIALTDTGEGMSDEVLELSDITTAIAELAVRHEVPASYVSDAVNELAASDSVDDLGRAIVQLAAMLGDPQAVALSGSTGAEVELADVGTLPDDDDPGVVSWAAGEVMRLSSTHSGLPWDQAKVIAASIDQPMARPAWPEGGSRRVELSASEASEVARLAGMHARRDRHGRMARPVSTAAPAGSMPGVHLSGGLAAQEQARYLSLAGQSVPEAVDVTDDGGETYSQDEITRYLNQAADLMGQAPLRNDAGNRSYAPKSYAQRTAEEAAARPGYTGGPGWGDGR